jgi:predicted DNA-binding transcriptional regulator YafY
MLAASSRLLDLLALLQSRPFWPGPELCRRLAVGPRTLRRDIERLRRLGYPVEARRGPAGGYRLAAGSAVPPLLLDDEEAIAIALGLRTASRVAVAGIEDSSARALAKLEQVLPAHLRHRVEALSAVATTTGSDGPRSDPETLAVLGAASNACERVRFRYRSRAGEESRREVEPHALVNHGRHWYLLAWDRAREDWRTFRVDRIEVPQALGVRFERRPIPGGDAAAAVAASLRSAAYRYRARVTLKAPAQEAERRFAASWGTITPIDERSCEYTTSDDDIGWLALRLLMLDVDFVVHEPPELLAELERLESRLRRAGGAANAGRR